ncbi:hypothetical protein [Chryseobacterium geocarposphaerae]|uniref:Uncharacterized protein n=1 Tax=Chryseobacterium geocarposphaerae TaxID=1416776 RepID=A0A2M9CBJ4_9FLAO|nr:hypothetical protein [Chryseobacterium geocarposphaerae]PJJ68142.1 hypothetical protein CLV73_2177 [Chryseobacterium geocarposphaerae]
MPPELKNRIVVNENSYNSKKPVVTKSRPEQKYWSFSFKYFREIEYFGVGDKNASWFISVLDKLKDMCNYDIDSFLANATIKQASRYHKINWEQKNIPLAREDFNWIDKSIIQNDDEFPFVQFQISKSLGRVVGFWYESIFYIVILDPMHNIQPAKSYNYAVDKTKIADNDYTSLLMDIDKIRRISCNHDCNIYKELCLIPTKMNTSNFYYFSLEDDYYAEFTEKIKDKSITELIELGIASL